MFDGGYIAPLNAIKKEAGTGSYRGMRWYLEKNENGELKATIYPEPNSFACTPDTEKEAAVFSFSEDGYQEMLHWLEIKYEEQKERWQNAPRI